MYIYIYIRHRAARHARACSGHPSGGLMSDVGLCLSVFKGPTACYLPDSPNSHPRFRAFF